jgi:peroxiredoxin
MTLSEEIQQLLASYNFPDRIAETVSEVMSHIEANRTATGILEGERAPDFELLGDSGARIHLSERLQQGPVVLSFFRGAWCPICNLQLRALDRALPQIRAAGASLIGIHPDASLIRPGRSGVDFDLAPDLDQSVIRAYRLQFTVPPRVREIYTHDFNTDISSYTADGSWNLPVPATFVIDPQGIVRRRHVNADFTRRMEPEEVIQALAQIRQGSS